MIKLRDAMLYSKRFKNRKLYGFERIDDFEKCSMLDMGLILKQ